MTATEYQLKSQPLDLETMKALLAPINQQIAGVAKGQAEMTPSVLKIEKAVDGMLPAIKNLQIDVKRLKKQLITKE